MSLVPGSLVLEINCNQIGFVTVQLKNQKIFSWKYYHGLTKEMREMLKIPPLNGDEKTPDFMKEMELFLKTPWRYLEPWNYAHSAYLFTVNPQLIFFGQPR